MTTVSASGPGLAADLISVTKRLILGVAATTLTLQIGSASASLHDSGNLRTRLCCIELERLASWSKTSDRHSCSVVELLDLFSDSCPSHEAIIFFILLELCGILLSLFQNCSVLPSIMLCLVARLEPRLNSVRFTWVGPGIILVYKCSRSGWIWIVKDLVHLSWLSAPRHYTDVSAVFCWSAQLHGLAWNDADIVLWVLIIIRSPPRIVLGVKLSTLVYRRLMAKACLATVRPFRYRSLLIALVTLDVTRDTNGRWRIHYIFDIILKYGCIAIAVVGNDTIQMTLHHLLSMVTAGDAVHARWLVVVVTRSLSLLIVDILLLSGCLSVSSSRLAPSDHSRWLRVLT